MRVHSKLVDGTRSVEVKTVENIASFRMISTLCGIEKNTAKRTSLHNTERRLYRCIIAYADIKSGLITRAEAWLNAWY